MELFGQLEKLCSDYEAEMQGKGFEFNVSLSDSFSLDVRGDAKLNVNPESSIEKYNETVTELRKKRVRREGWTHQLLKIVSFGYRDDYEVEVFKDTREMPRYRVVLDDYVREAEQLADAFYKDIEARLEKQFEEKLVPAVDDVFAEVIVAVQGVEEALDQSKKMKVENVAVISTVREMMDEVKRENVNHLQRVDVARLGVGSLVVAKSEAV